MCMQYLSTGMPKQYGELALPAHVHACALLGKFLSKVVVLPACREGGQVVRDAESMLVEQCMGSEATASAAQPLLIALGSLSGK